MPDKRAEIGNADGWNIMALGLKGLAASGSDDRPGWDTLKGWTTVWLAEPGDLALR